MKVSEIKAMIIDTLITSERKIFIYVIGVCRIYSSRMQDN